MSIEFKHAVIINCSLQTAYQAIVLAESIVRFFPTEASGNMEAGKVIEWKWGTQQCDIKVSELEVNKCIKFDWQAHKVDYDTSTVIELEEKDSKTKVIVKESGWLQDEEGITSAIEHSAGWMHFLLCMKTWLEHGIDLRV